MGVYERRFYIPIVLNIIQPCFPSYIYTCTYICRMNVRIYIYKYSLVIYGECVCSRLCFALFCPYPTLNTLHLTWFHLIIHWICLVFLLYWHSLKIYSTVWISLASRPLNELEYFTLWRRLYSSRWQYPEKNGTEKWDSRWRKQNEVCLRKYCFVGCSGGRLRN